MQVLIGKDRNMTKMIKKIASILLTATMVLSFVPTALAENIQGWTVSYTRGCQGNVTIDRNVFYEGNGAMKITNKTPVLGSTYINITTPVDLKEGRKYKIGAKVKSQNSTYLQITIDWGKRYDFTALGKTYDWTNYEFNYTADKTKTATFQILCEGITDGAWLDNIQCIDVQTGENLISNSTFDSENIGAVGDDGNNYAAEEIDYAAMQKKYDLLKSSDSFTVDEMNEVIGALKYIPIYKLDNAKIDGNDEEWDGIMPIAVPTLPTQFQVYIDDDRIKDMQAICKFAYDDDNLYIYADVLDDIFYVGSPNYWDDDSIQFTFSDMNESYGAQVGIRYEPTAENGKVYSSFLSSSQIEAIDCSVKRNGHRTAYEIAIPWSLKWSEKPKSLLFDILLNDNDGDGRRYAAEMAPGIAEGKINEKFPILELKGENTSDWYSWIEGDRSVNVGEEGTYDYYLVNMGEEREFTIKNKTMDTEETVVVPKGCGIRRGFNCTFDEAGIYNIEVDTNSADETVEAKLSAKIKKPEMTKEYAEAFADRLEEKVKIIADLLEQCKLRGIDTDYETADYRILEKYVGFTRDEVKNNYLVNVYNTEDITNEIFEQNKADLEAYLSGEKKPKSVPKYRTSDIKIDGQTMYATFDVDGKLEERPAFFVGYGHGGGTESSVLKEMNSLPEFGINTIQTEYGITGLFRTAYLFSGWYDYIANGASSTYKRSTDAHSGNSAMMVTYNDKLAASHYFTVFQNVKVEPGKTYEFKGWTKGKDVSKATVSAENFDNRIELNGSYDWKEFTKEYTAPVNATSTTVRIIVQDYTDAIYFDDFSFCEKGTTNNLLKNGDFETFNEDNVLELITDDDSIKKRWDFIIQKLKQAEEDNIAVDMLMSPHYWPSDFANVHPETKYTGYTYAEDKKVVFNEFNVNAPAARKAVEEYLRYIVPKIKDFKSLKSICLTNEPKFYPECCGDYYLDDWHEFLKERYGTIENLNKSYESDYSSFDDVSLLKSMEQPAKQYDYMLFDDKIFSEWHKFMADIVHELAPNIPVHIKTQAYLYTDYTRHHLFMGGIGYENYADFSDLNGCDAVNEIRKNNTNHPLNKLLWYDYMRSIKNAPIVNSEDHLNGSDIVEENLGLSSRPKDGIYAAQDIYQGAIHGRAMSQIWIWQRAYKAGQPGWGGIMFKPDAISAISETSMDLNRLAYEITALQNEKAEVGIIYCPETIINVDTGMNAMYEAYQAAAYNGKNIGIIVKQQLEKMKNYRLVIVPGAKYISSDVLYALKDYIDNGGNVLILGENTMMKNEKNLDNDKSLVDYIYNHSTVLPFESNTVTITNPTQDELFNAVGELCDKIGISYVTVRDAKTGERVNCIDYNIAIYNGKLLVNLDNLSEDKEVNVFVNGKRVDKATELRSGNEVGSNIELKKYIPIMLQIDVDNCFFDTYGSWAENDIAELSKKEIVKGVSSSRFEPNANITRAEFLALLMRSLNADTTVKYLETVSDVSGDAWYAGTIQAAIDMGIVKGNAAFRPDIPITREEMCDMLIKCYEIQHGEVKNYNNAGFGDIANSAYNNSISKAVALNLMVGRGNNSFVPHGNATRAESAAVIARYLK